MSATVLSSVVSVGVASEQALVGDAVRASLTSRGFRTETLRWPGGQDARRPRPAPHALPPVGLLISDLDTAPRLLGATLLLSHVPVAWVVLTSAPRGPLWGAALEAGARTVLPSSAGFDEVCRVLDVVAGGGTTLTAADRGDLVERWGELCERRQTAGERVQLLTPREREVLRMLYAGDSVARIAQLLEISPATVRSQVKAVLRKLQVNTQLGAVAAWGDVLELESFESTSAG